jgi:hypothetical protein
MRRAVSKSVVVFAAFCLVVLLLPLTVTAEVQTQVTEIASFSPYESNNAEVDNIANDTIQYNFDTWDPLPPGMFVGGTIRESKMQLQEYAVGIEQGVPGIRRHYSEFYLAQPMKLSQAYVMSGASQFVVRLPNAMDEYLPSYIVFKIFKMDSATDYSIVRRAAYFGAPLGAGSDAELDVVAADGSNLNALAWGVAGPTYSDSPSSWVYLRAGRLYMQLMAPLHPDEWYLLTSHAYYRNDSRWQFYLTAGDLGSDNVTASHVAYEYHPAADQNMTRDFPVPADLGFSFVFKASLGLYGASYSRLFNAGDELRFNALIPIGTQNYYEGCLNLVTEFRMNLSDKLTWGLEVKARVNEAGVGNVTKTVISHTYWTGKQDDGMIVASNPVTWNYTSATLIAGTYYINAQCTIFIEASKRVEFMLVDDGSSALYSYQVPYQILWRFSGAGTNLEMNFFNLWSTVSLDNRSLNWTGGVVAPHHSRFWEGVGHWWDKHWVDIVALTLIVGAIALTPFTLGGSLALLGMGITLLLYHNLQGVRDFINGLIKYVLDGLEWLGEWLYKIGMFIWKALTWLLDQAIYYGSILIGLLVIAVAIALFIGPLYAMIKIMGAFLMMAQGDYDKAAAQLSGLVAQGRSAASTLTGGRLG